MLGSRLVVELGLAVRGSKSVDAPDDVVGQAAEDRFVVAVSEAVHVAVDSLQIGVHVALSISHW